MGASFSQDWTIAAKTNPLTFMIFIREIAVKEHANPLYNFYGKQLVSLKSWSAIIEPILIKYKVSGYNTFMSQSIFGIWPAATNVVALRPHQTKRVSTAIPSWITQPPLTKNAEKRMIFDGDLSSF
ncbi:hypothetical protein [Shewanella sp. UCD-KL21]|uniref:hypothetical protein n=1 Tax=Shewanella sp. UCD-KL21 TaxID=1917164 RepID=UPI000970D4DC|nr:hypothetical protein [Shewanella sp. UCD-KL21]